MKIDPDYLHFSHLSDPSEFDKRFMSKIQHVKYEVAYEEVEAEYSACYGENKYSNFESFYRSWRVRQKRQLENRVN